jgi:hypothetical protein
VAPFRRLLTLTRVMLGVAGRQGAGATRAACAAAVRADGQEVKGPGTTPGPFAAIRRRRSPPANHFTMFFFGSSM